MKEQEKGNTGITLGSIYTDEMIGQNITYSSNGQSDWIIFGKDESGNILITTELPIDNAYTLNGSAATWLTYEDDLNDACSGYGGTIQGVSVSSRSITLEDINYVSGFTEPDFDTYTFGSTSDYDNKYVNYYYPSLDATDNSYWQNPNSVSTTFENNAYCYYCSWSSGDYLYGYSGTKLNDASADGLIANTDNLKYIWGGNTEETRYNTYLVASRSVYVYSSSASFYVANVGYSLVGSDYSYLCYSDSAGGYDRGSLGSYGVRPVVVLSSNLLVEDQGEGTYDLAS